MLFGVRGGDICFAGLFSLFKSLTSLSSLGEGWERLRGVCLGVTDGLGFLATGRGLWLLLLLLPLLLGCSLAVDISGVVLTGRGGVVFAGGGGAFLCAVPGDTFPGTGGLPVTAGFCARGGDGFDSELPGFGDGGGRDGLGPVPTP